MKNISSIQKSNKIESPKTPGGISKSLLTPCRRIGLSRNWKRSGASPFVSPLSGTVSAEVKQEQASTKRKCLTDEESFSSSKSNEDDLIESSSSCLTPRTIDSTRTPTRNLLHRKKCKTLLLTKEYEEENVPLSTLNINIKSKADSEDDNSNKNIKVIKLSRSNSKNKSKTQKSPIEDTNTGIVLNPSPSSEVNNFCEQQIKNETQYSSINKIDLDKKSPDNLTKECMVVIHKKIFKTECDKIKPTNPISQSLFDSDSDDIPLSNLNKTDNQNVIIIKDDEFQDKKSTLKQLQNKTSSSELKTTSKVKEKNKQPKNETQSEIKTDKSSITSLFDDDDDFVSDKKTILIKKSYNKISKVSKSKSTGSITQKDIDELMARIETKKNLLLAKAMTKETAELRNLIKKWQKGCQSALTELLELMKAKMPEQNMNYAEMLQILKIPPDLVGYDSENDCFNTPDDVNIVLSDFVI